MNILAISDLHGYFPEVPECDLLLIGGDYAPTRNIEQQHRFFTGPFSEWLRSVKARFIVGIGGNHDFALQDSEFARSLPWTYLCDSEVNLEGVRVYGTPYTPMFYNWAFMESEEELEKRFSKIPTGLDIVLSHGPVYRKLDKTISGVRCGSRCLDQKIRDVKPDSFVCGHIHEAHGIVDTEHTRFYNVAHVNEMYEPKHTFVNIPLKDKD